MRLGSTPRLPVGAALSEALAGGDGGLVGHRVRGGGLGALLRLRLLAQGGDDIRRPSQAQLQPLARLARERDVADDVRRNGRHRGQGSGGSPRRDSIAEAASHVLAGSVAESASHFVHLVSIPSIIMVPAAPATPAEKAEQQAQYAQLAADVDSSDAAGARAPPRTRRRRSPRR